MLVISFLNRCRVACTQEFILNPLRSNIFHKQENKNNRLFLALPASHSAFLLLRTFLGLNGQLSTYYLVRTRVLKYFDFVMEIITFGRAMEIMLKDQYSGLPHYKDAKYRFKLPITYVNTWDVGILEYLDSKKNVFVLSFPGFLIAYEYIRSSIPINLANYLGCEVLGDFIFFCPEIGRILRGIVTEKIPMSVTCSVHGIFPAVFSKPKDKIVWIGDGVHIGDWILFLVTKIGVKRLHGTITSIEKSVTVPNEESDDEIEKLEDDATVVASLWSLFSGLG
uniref:Uncharacterized protein n=1 Tax=Strigamia maritima TaxID=126957 RepID=T1JF68_STRMM